MHHRRFFDLNLSQMNRAYLDTLFSYQKALAQRNKLLKQIARGNAGEEQLAAWDEVLLGDAVRIMEERAAFVEKMRAAAADRYERFEKAELNIFYAPKYPVCGDNPQRELRAHLQAARARELKAGVTLVGPHRDRLGIELGGKSLRHYGSRGQKRCAMISIMLAAAGEAAEFGGRDVVLLLDEAFAELDSDKSLALLEMLGDFRQVFIAAAGNLDFSRMPCRRFRVDRGKITEE